MCFIDTPKEPYVLYWHSQEALCALLTLPGALCALLTLQGGPMCFFENTENMDFEDFDVESNEIGILWYQSEAD